VFWDVLFSFLGGFMWKLGVSNNEECQKGENAFFTKSEFHKNQYYCSLKLLKRAGDTREGGFVNAGRGKQRRTLL
jgi:hypothetical protein